MNRYGFEPDFENLRTVLLGGTGYRVPNIELVIDQEIKDGFMGWPVVTLEDESEFRYQAGYDYAWISIGMIDPAGTVNKEFVQDSDEKHFVGKDRRAWADEHEGIIRDRQEMETFPWPDPGKLDYAPFAKAAECLKPGMKAIAILGKIFTGAWQLVGFERFCELMYQDPVFLQELVSRIGRLQVEVCKRVVGIDTVGAVWVPDDIAYRSGPLLSPDWFKEHVFSHYRVMGEICHQADVPFIYHSDGDLSSVLDMIMDAGFDALHPIEPESMDIYQLRQRVKKRICLLGNIRVHTLATAKPHDIRELVKDRVVNLGHKGAYCVGSSNSIPNYVLLENYDAMLQANADFGFIK